LLISPFFTNVSPPSFGITVQFKKISSSSPNNDVGGLVLLDDFCKTDVATNSGITVDTSIGNGQVCFTMHRPSSGYQLLVDIEVELWIGDSCTTATCNTKRRRRRNIGEERRDEQVSTIFNIDPEDTCNRDCGDGSCVIDFYGVQQCVCYDNAYKTNGGYCRGTDTGLPGAVAGGSTSIFIIVGVAVGLLLTLVILSVFVARRRYNAEKDEVVEKS
jgi:hypothetical protein